MIEISTRVDHRQAPALEAREQLLAFGVVGGRLGVVQDLAVVGVALEHDQRTATPLREPERPAADRVRHDLLAVHLDHLARDCAEQVTAGERLVEARARLLELEADRVAVERADAGDLAVVVERLAAVDRFLAQRGQAQELRLEDAGRRRALVGGVDEAL